VQQLQGITTGPCGYSADTEILTRGGWVTFDRLTCLDEVATRTPEGRFEWHYPERVAWERYDGEMIWFHSRTANLLAAPETPVLHMFSPRATANGKRYELPAVERTLPAARVRTHGVSLVAASTWIPANPKHEFAFKPTRFIPPGWRRPQGKPPKSFTASAADFASFMGMYLAEGSLNGTGGMHRIDIWQGTKGKGFCEFQDLLNRLLDRHVPWHASSGSWGFLNKALFEFLKPCGGYAWTKAVPPEVLEMPSEHLEQFWHYYWLGDGTTMNTGEDRKPLQVISTTSRVMADQLQEIIQKLGGWALIQAIDFSKYPSKLGKTTHLTYRLVRRAGTTAFATHVERVPYSGMIGNAETGIGPVYVRRNYRPVWAGS
jgi:hypothetical protein